MVAPTLTNYTYQYKDTGVLLNGDTAPFWDVEKIEGLVDLPSLDVTTLDLDGRHGSFVSAKYAKSRTLIISGTLYDSVANVAATNETLRNSLIPTDIDAPFYYKEPGITQRYLMCKPIDYKADVQTGRRVGKMPYQIQFGCTDPRAFIDLSALSFTSTVTTSAHSNAGNVNGPFTVNITAASTQASASLTIANPLAFTTVTLSGFSVTSGQAIVVDCDKWLVYKAGVLIPVAMAPGSTGFPYFYPGSNTWTVTSNFGNGTINAKSAWL